MRVHVLVLALALGIAAWLVPQAARADMKVATISIKGMVCQA